MISLAWMRQRFSNRQAVEAHTLRQVPGAHKSASVSRPTTPPGCSPAIERREVEARFTLLTSNHGWAIGNQVISLLRSIYRRACVDHEGLRNPGRPVAGGGRVLQPDCAPGDLIAGGSPALLAARHRGGGEGPGHPLHLLGCHVLRNAAG